MSPIQRLSPEQMERKFVEIGMEQIHQRCTSKHIPRPHNNPLKKKREYTVETKDSKGEIRSIICYFEDPDGTEKRSIRYMKSDNGQEFGAE